MSEPPAGFVFDLDGTLVDNMSLHAAAFVDFAARHGLPPLDAAARARFDGRRNRDIFPDLLGRPLAEAELRRYSDEKESLYRELSRGRLSPLPGLLRLLDLLSARGIAIALATSAPAENVAHTLRELGLERLTNVTRSDEVPRGKPFPDVFLKAAERIGVAAERCVAFEDAPLGVRAARAAVMTVVAVTTSFSPAAFREHGADFDHACRDFEEYLAGPGGWLLGDNHVPGP
jgi:HAD superfamily hydrolase (TIGR01509 family)